MILNREQQGRFVEMYNMGTSFVQLAFEFNVSHKAIGSIVNNLRLPPRDRRRPMPVDFEEKLQLLGIEGARVHYQCGWGTIKRWIEEEGLVKPDFRQVRPTGRSRPIVVPDDWAEVAPTKYKFELAEHYRMGVNRVNQIIALTGIRSRKTLHELAKERPPVERKPKAPRPRRSYRSRNGIVPGAATLNASIAQQAANHLRRSFPNVHRCDIQLREFERKTWGDQYGVPNHGIGHYFVSGRGVMTDEELIELAGSHGFCPSFH